MAPILGLRVVVWSLSIIFVLSQNVKSNASVSVRACACYNQGICDPWTGACICPSGFVGQQCERSDPYTLCNNIVCKNSGVCNVLSSTVSMCWCLLGFHGDYCERQTAGSRCNQVQCRNGATCYEHSPGSSIFPYCLCPPGFRGKFCEIEYFRCSQAGTFADAYKCAQGSYFLCDYSNRLILGNCPKGLRFNFNKMSCDHANAVSCPTL